MNRVREVREAAGFESTFALTKLFGLNHSLVRLLELGKKAAMVRGSWRVEAAALAEALDTFPEHLWPEEADDWSTGAEESSVRSPAELYDLVELEKHVKKVLSTIPAHEAVVLTRRFGLGMWDFGPADEFPSGLGDAGKGLGRAVPGSDLTLERVRQIEAKALRKLRHPARSKRLREFYEPATPSRTSRILQEERAARAEARYERFYRAQAAEQRRARAKNKYELLVWHNGEVADRLRVNTSDEETALQILRKAALYVYEAYPKLTVVSELRCNGRRLASVASIQVARDLKQEGLA